MTQSASENYLIHRGSSSHKISTPFLAHELWMSGVCTLPETWLGCVKPFSGECALFWMKQAGKRPIGLKCILYLKQLTKHSSSYHFLDPSSLPRPLVQPLAGALKHTHYLSGCIRGGCYPGMVATWKLVDMRTRRLLWEPQPLSHWIHYPRPSTRKGHPSSCSCSLWEIIPPGIIRKYSEALTLWDCNKELSDSPMKKRECSVSI